MNNKNNNKNNEEEYDDLSIYENNSPHIIKEDKNVYDEQLDENNNSDKDSDDKNLDFIDKKEDDDKEEILLRNKDYNDKISIDKNVFDLINKSLKNINKESERLNNIIKAITANDKNLFNSEQDNENYQQSQIDEAGKEKKVIEGIFNGQSMIGFDGKQYSMPANYASKSKLVEGDTLKLTINNNGAFIYKQISLVERKRVIGKLQRDKNNNFYVESDGKQWKILTASITFFHGEVGDEIVIIIPKQGESNWATVENIISKQKYD